jgi:hypothetical protein
MILPVPDWIRIKNLKQHIPFLFVLLLHLTLALLYSSLVPLGEAPDESAHLGYARFIANYGRLPTTLTERQEADYRSDFPPLYYLIIAPPLAAVGDAPPTRLKSVGDTPRRLIPTNGQTIAAFIHTADEAWPWRGITLGWHLSRFVSVMFTTLAVITTYAIAWRLTEQRNMALSAAALHAFIPQVLFVGSVLNEDSLLIFLSGLILLTLISYTKPPRLPGLGHTFLLGILLGLASVSKYNALPFWPLVGGWGIWLTYRKLREETGSLLPKLKRLAQHLIVLLVGVILTAGWWLGFVWFHFNEIDRLGLIRGSLAAFTTTTHDTTLQKIAAGASITLPPATAWLEWGVTIFKSFWGLFGGGGAIELPAWVYWLLATFCLLAAIPYIVYYVLRNTQADRYGRTATRTMFHATRFTLPYSVERRAFALPTPYSLLFLTPLFFLPLPILRFILTEANIAESAQGRHLFPALPAITLALIWGLSRITPYALRMTYHVLHLEIILPAFTLFLSLYALPLIQSSYPPPISLHTTADAATVKNPLNAKLAEGVTLVGYEPDQADEGVLPLTLVWQAEAIPLEDYLIELTLTDASGQPLGGWIGHPLGGRYPTRAWDKGDILRDTIPIPLLPRVFATEATLNLQLLFDTNNQPAAPPLTLTTNLSLSPSSQLPSPSACPEPPGPGLETGRSRRAPLLPAQLRADGLPPKAPFTYRSTLSFVLPDTSASPKLTAPSGQTFPALRFLTGLNGSVAHFIVGANWPSGDYQFNPAPSLLPIENRPRQFEPPPMDHTLNANFADYITLLGYNLPRRRVQPGESFPVTLHLRAERTLGQNLVIFNHLLDQNANQRGGADRVPLKHYTTLLWAPGETVSDAYEVFVETTAPPGVYWLDVGLYPSDQLDFSLPLFVNGQPIAQNSVRLGPIKVGGPPPGVTVPDVQPQHPLNKNFGDQITLLGFNLTDVDGNPLEDVIRNTQHVILTLFWQADTIPSADYTVFVHLLDSEGNLAAQFDSPPVAGAYPTSLWDPHEIIADERLLNNLAPGRYILLVGLYRADTGERLPIEGSGDGEVRLMEFKVE